jgi:hypothetical protein
MTLNDLYLVSQIAAAILVAPTLLYLALQVRQNTKQMRANASVQWVEASGQLNALVAGDREAASVFRRGWDGPDGLDDDERMQYLVHMGHFMQIYSTMYDLHAEGLLPETQWHNCRKDLVSIMSSRGGVWVWDVFGKRGLNPTFVAFVEKLRASGEAPYDISTTRKDGGAP